MLLTFCKKNKKCQKCPYKTANKVEIVGETAKTKFTHSDSMFSSAIRRHPWYSHLPQYTAKSYNLTRVVLLEIWENTSSESDMGKHVDFK
jgi:hypothetical protein